MPELEMISADRYAVVLMISFPLLFVLCGEIAHRLSSRHEPLSHAIRTLRNVVLPLLVAVCTVRYVARVRTDVWPYKLLLTTFWIASVFVTISFVNAVLFDEAHAQSWRANVPTFLRNISRGVLVLLGTAIIMTNVWGADLKGALTALGVGSIVLGLALQGTLGGIVSGVALLIDRPFREGDVVKIGDIVGTVREMNWRSVRVQSGAQHLLVIPNGQLADQTIINLSRPQAWQIEAFKFRFSHDDPPTSVKAMLLEVASSLPHVMEEPEPRVRILEYADFSIVYEVRIAVPVAHGFETHDELLTRIWYATRRHGFTMPYPISMEYQSDQLEVRTSRFEQARNEARKALTSSLPLEGSVIDALIKDSIRKEYAPKEVVVAEGGIARALFFVVKGKGAAGLKGKNQEWVEVGQLHRGDFFGAGSLLRGEPSQLSFRTLTDLVVLEIPAKKVIDITKSHPKFAVELQRLMAQRQKLVDEVRQRHALADLSPLSPFEGALDVIAGRQEPPREADPPQA